MNIIELTWEDIMARIEYVKKKNKIKPNTKIYGVPKNGMIIASFFGCISVYDPKKAEARLYNYWETEGYFKCGLTNNQPFSIVIPPPNVTGSLHMGHALNNTLQDIIVRYKRMLGEDVLWQTGTDHAGIATQMVVERKLDSENKPSRIELGGKNLLMKSGNGKENLEA